MASGKLGGEGLGWHDPLLTPAPATPTRVAMVTAFPADPAAPRGGVEAVSVNLCSALAPYDDLDLHVVTSDPHCEAPTVSGWNGVHIHRLPWRGRRQLTAALGRGRRQMKRYLLGLAPRVVHCHDLYGIMVNGLPIPRVFTVHGFIHADTRVSGDRWAWLRSQVWRLVETRSWADHPHIISISPYVRERLSGIARGVIHDIDNPIAATFFETAHRERPNVVLSVGVIDARKNTLGLLEAFARVVARVPRAQLRLAGSVRDPAYGRRVEGLTRALGIEGNVVMAGSLTTDQLRQELSAASVFALTSLEENSPLAIAEAMAVGVPVVTSNRCGMPYMVRHGESGFLVDPLAPDDVASRVLHVLQDDALRAAMGETSRRIARDRFHPEAVARRTRAVYLEALSSGSAPVSPRSTR